MLNNVFKCQVSYHSLQVDLRIPVAVIENDNVCRGQVDSQTSSSGTEQKDELLAVWMVVGIDAFLWGGGGGGGGT